MVFLLSYEISTRLMVANAFVGAILVFFGVILTALGTIAIATGFNALSDTGPLMPELTLEAADFRDNRADSLRDAGDGKRLTGLKPERARE